MPTLAVARCARSASGLAIRDTDRPHGSNSSQPVAPPIRTRLRLGEARPQVLDDSAGPPATQMLQASLNAPAAKTLDARERRPPLTAAGAVRPFCGGAVVDGL